MDLTGKIKQLFVDVGNCYRSKGVADWSIHSHVDGDRGYRTDAFYRLNHSYDVVVHIWAYLQDATETQTRVWARETDPTQILIPEAMTWRDDSGIYHNFSDGKLFQYDKPESLRKALEKACPKLREVHGHTGHSHIGHHH